MKKTLKQRILTEMVIKKKGRPIIKEKLGDLIFNMCGWIFEQYEDLEEYDIKKADEIREKLNSINIT